YANGAREGLRLSEDTVGTHGNVISTRGRHVRHASDHRLARASLGDRTPDRIARHARAPRTVNTQDNGFHRRIFSGGLQGFHERVRAHESTLPERAFLALAAAYDAMGIDQGKLGSRCCLLL